MISLCNIVYIGRRNGSQSIVKSLSIITIGANEYKKHRVSLADHGGRVYVREVSFRVKKARTTVWISAWVAAVVDRAWRTLAMTLTTSCREIATGLMSGGVGEGGRRRVRKLLIRERP